MRRTGATLMEVLVSILIMAIGVVSVASIFPIAILRSVQANQLTMATDLRKNAESLMDVYPFMIHDPDQNPSTPDVRWIVDPLGWVNADPAMRDVFGHDGSGATGTIPRYHCGFNTNEKADPVFSCQDTWVDLIEASDLSPNLGTSPESVDVPSLREVKLRNTVDLRAIFWDADDSVSHIRKISVTDDSDTITWEQLLPAGFTPDRVVVQSWERRFSYLFTVTQESEGIATVELVVFFRRSFDPLDEQIFTVNGPTNNSRTATVSWSGQKPFLRKGSWFMNAKTGKWHQLVNFSESGSTAELEFSPGAAGLQGAIFPRGVVDVYPLGQKSGAN